MTDQTELALESENVHDAQDAAYADGDTPSYRKIAPEVWAEMTIEEKIRAIVADVPQEVWDEVPDDLSYQHDHYIYGTPKRPEPGTPEYEREGEALAAADLDAPVERLAYEDIPPHVWAAMTFTERARAIFADVPPEVWDEIPDDLSYQHDHYIYGWPKKP